MCWWERLSAGKTGSCSGGQSHAQQIFNPTVCWWVWQWSFRVSCLAWCDSVLESAGSIVVLPVTSRKDLCQRAPTRADAASVPIPAAGQCQAMPPREILKHSQTGPAHSLVGSLLLSPGSWCTQDFVCALLEEGERGQRKSWLKTQYSKKKLRLWHSVPSLHGKQMEIKWKQHQIVFSWAPKSRWTVTTAMKLKNACSLEEKLWQT